MPRHRSRPAQATHLVHIHTDLRDLPVHSRRRARPQRASSRIADAAIARLRENRPRAPRFGR
jgi:hypothetical protein